MTVHVLYRLPNNTSLRVKYKWAFKQFASNHAEM